MKEIFEFRIYEKYYDLLSKPNNALFNGAVYIVKASRGDSVFEELRKINEHVRSNLSSSMFSYTAVKRTYLDKELKGAKLFHFWPIRQVAPTGEECGTLYDDSVACDICGETNILSFSSERENSPERYLPYIWRRDNCFGKVCRKV